jgi:hypothetical protein
MKRVMKLLEKRCPGAGNAHQGCGLLAGPGHIQAVEQGQGPHKDKAKSGNPAVGVFLQFNGGQADGFQQSVKVTPPRGAPDRI